MRLSLISEDEKASGSNDLPATDPTSNDEYIQPDTFMNRTGSVTFFYTAEGRLYYSARPTDSHEEMIAMHGDLFDRYTRTTGLKTGNPKDLRNAPKGYPETVDITGRLGNIGKKRYLTIWNFKKSVIDSLMKDCIAKLLQKRLITPDTIVSTPITPNATVADWQAGKMAETREVSKDEEERMELMKKLHNMASPQKHETMKKLGLGAGFGSEYKHRSSEPGTKWWAPTSESLQKRLSKLFGV